MLCNVKIQKATSERQVTETSIALVEMHCNRTEF